MSLDSKINQLHFIHLCSFVFFLFGFIVLLLLYSTLFFEPLLMIFVIMFIIYLIIVKIEGEYVRLTPQVLKFLSPFPSNYEKLPFKLLWNRLKMLLIRAFIAENKQQIKKAAKFYYYALKIDNELGKFYSQKLLNRLDKMESAYIVSNNTREENQRLEKINLDLFNKAQNCESNDDLLTAIRNYKKIRLNHMRIFHFHNAFQTDEIIQRLQFQFSKKNRKLG